uniref:G_PROTEIN_RECEP_F1_2 domain-containing protein n=1 Tax=Ascaris lumbricoides TaxID=6252 RepID=A0A0M3INP4_ASCLU
MNDYVVTNATVWKNFLWRRHSQTCTPIQQSLPDKVDLLQVQIIFSVLYFLVWIVAVSGNSLVLYIVTVKQGGSIFVSSFTLTVIAVDRMLLILYPSRAIITFERALSIVLGIWAIGYSLSLPNGIFSRTVHYFPYCGTFCEEAW